VHGPGEDSPPNLKGESEGFLDSEACGGLGQRLGAAGRRGGQVVATVTGLEPVKGHGGTVVAVNRALYEDRKGTTSGGLQQRGRAGQNRGVDCEPERARLAGSS
jgi:hypothetical protein